MQVPGSLALVLGPFLVPGPEAAHRRTSPGPTWTSDSGRTKHEEPRTECDGRPEGLHYFYRRRPSVNSIDTPHGSVMNADAMLPDLLYGFVSLMPFASSFLQNS